MAEKRASWTGKDLPADNPRDKGDSQLRLVSPDGLFSEDSEPNDESPTIISKAPPHDEPNLGDGKDLQGRTLAHFELLESIGVGGMAAVLRARDTQLDRFVALKILPPEMARDEENIRRFHQEARAAAKLDHENIARVFYCGEDQGLHFIAFEYVEGDNLKTILERRGHVPHGEAIRYVLQIATGLEHAASRGVVHRDIKPSNIIIGPSGRAKVVDMGLARSLEPHADNGLTQSGVTLGTFDYISPEQALEPREADCRSDIYSLGCTFYHMLTGRPPVPEGTAAKKLQHHQHVAPLDPRQINPEIPDDVARILGRMMAKNARDRYQRPIQLVQDLMHVARQSGQDFGHEPLFVDMPVPVAPHRRPMLIAPLAILILAGLLFVLSLAPQPTKVKRALASNDEHIAIALDSDIKLTGGLKIAGTANVRPSVEIVGPEIKPGRPPVRLWLSLDAAPTEARSGLTIDGAKVSFKNIAFEIVAAETVKPRLEVPVAAVAVSGDSIVDFDNCSFAQSGLRSDIPFIQQRKFVPAASLFVNATSKSRVTVQHSYFPTGQSAIAMVGSGHVIARDCAFHSLGALFHLKSGGDPIKANGEPRVDLEHCSAYLTNGPAFRIDDETTCRLKVDYSLFSVPFTAQLNGDKPDLLRQTDSSDVSKISFTGQSNGYHNLNSLWVQSDTIVAFDDLKAFRQRLDVKKGYDKDSQIIPKDPSPFLKETAKSDDLEGAFELSEAVPAVRLSADKHSSRHPMLGIRECFGVKMEVLRALPAEPAIVVGDFYKPAPNEKVVVPDYAGSAPGYFDSLNVALGGIHDQNIITLKPSATVSEFTLKPTDLDVELTIRGFPGTFPTLTLGDTPFSEAYLFRLVEGKLHLENLHLVLTAREGFASLALVNMVNGVCNIKNCAITLKRANNRSTSLSVVTTVAGEEAKAMMNDTRPSLFASTVRLQECFVRGEGDVVTLRGSRAVNVYVNKSLCVVGGSLVHQLQAATKEIANDAAITVRMKDSAFFFGDPLFWLQAGKAMPRYQHPLRVELADHCLFATLADRPLVSFETPEPFTEKTLPQFFDWKGFSGNAYVHFDNADLLEQAAFEDAPRMYHLDDDSWKETIERDGDSQFLPMGLKMPPQRPLSSATPDEIVIRPEFMTELQPYFMHLPKFLLPKN
jgi:predicted Ser/Thr protein kinase